MQVFLHYIDKAYFDSIVCVSIRLDKHKILKYCIFYTEKFIFIALYNTTYCANIDIVTVIFWHKIKGERVWTTVS